MHFCSLKSLCAIFRGHFGNFGNLGGTNNTFGKLWGLKSNFGKGICGLWTHRLGVFLIKVIGLGLRLLKWIGLCIELGLFPNRLDRPTSSISLISSYLLLIDMAKWVRIFWPGPNPFFFFFFFYPDKKRVDLWPNMCFLRVNTTWPTIWLVTWTIF